MKNYWERKSLGPITESGIFLTRLEKKPSRRVDLSWSTVSTEPIVTFFVQQQMVLQHSTASRLFYHEDVCTAGMAIRFAAFERKIYT
jgi:hypothetical protein